MKKGFTLIELLAVLVVLSIIALISIPIVYKVLEQGRISALEDSTEFYIKEIESAYAEWAIEGFPEDLVVRTDDKYDYFNVSQLNNVLKLQGTKPLSGTIAIGNDYMDVDNYYGYVIEATLTYDGGYNVTYTYEEGKKNIEVKKQ